MLGLRWRTVVVAVACAFALRLVFVLAFPGQSGDAIEYDELARNWVDHGVYGMVLDGHLVPMSLRMPGYPSVLALYHSVFGGHAHVAVMLTQAIVDSFTVVLVAAIAAHVSPARDRARVSTVALWLAVLCPFTASFTRHLLTESFATCLTMLASLLMMRAYERGRGWITVGLVVGSGTLLRPEAPVLLASFGVVFMWQWRARPQWRRIRTMVLHGALGLAIALTPWVVRNAMTFGTFQPLVPLYAIAPQHDYPGFRAWTASWLVDERDAAALWSVDGRLPLDVDKIPDDAFDSSAERDRVRELVARYNEAPGMSREVDAGFAELASDRASRHPFRSRAELPFRRAVQLWVTPEVEFGAAPLRIAARLLCLGYVLLFAVGVWRQRSRPEIWGILVLLAARTIVFAYRAPAEPRYMVLTLPFLLATGALIAMRRD